MKFFKKIFSFIVKIRYILLGLWATLLIVSLVFIPRVQVNYDSTKYLPADARSTASLKVMKEEFGLVGQASLMVENVTIDEAIRIKNTVKDIDGVGEVIWLDTFIEALVKAMGDELAIDMNDVTQISKFLKENLSKLNLTIPGIDQFYKGGSALYQVMFEEDDYSLKTGNAIEKIREKVANSLGEGQTYAMGGSAVSSILYAHVNELRSF